MRNYGFEFATPQTIAKIQDEQIERERARRVKESNYAAFDEARRAERAPRGGSVSTVQPVAGGAVSRSDMTIGDDGFVQRGGWNVQAGIESEFSDLAARSAAVRRHNAQVEAATLNAAMRASRANGGRLPQNLVDAISRRMGMDGRNQAVYQAGYLGNGDFDIDIVTRGANGGLQRTTKKITPLEQYNMMLASPGVWGEDGVSVSQELYGRLRGTRGKSELQAPGVYADNLRAYNAQRQSADTMKTVLGYYQAMQKELNRSGGGRQPMSVADIRMRLAEKIMADPKLGQAVMSVPDLNDDGTQKMVEDENGNQVPAMRRADPNNEEDVKRVRQNMAMQLDLVPDLRLVPREGQANQDLAERMAMFDHIYNRVNPPMPPDALAFQQRQRERQMRQVEDEQFRADMTSRPQQLINYYKDGKWYSGNGYIRDGRVYDGQGREIDGATPAEMVRGEGGRLVQNGGGGFATRALPSARELVGGGASGGAVPASQLGAEPPQSADAQGAQQSEPQDAQPAQEAATGPRSAQDAQSKAAAVADAKAKRAAIIEERLRRDRERGGLPKGVLPNDKLPDWMTSGTVGPTLENERRAKDADAEAEKAAVDRERRLIEHINSFGGKVERDQFGNQVVHISKYEYLPDDMKKKYPDGIVTGVPLEAADEIQRQAEMGFREHAKATGERRRAAEKVVEAEARKLSRELRERYPTDAETRRKKYSQGLHEIRMKNDEAYRKNFEAEQKRRANAPLMSLPFG